MSNSNKQPTKKQAAEKAQHNNAPTKKNATDKTGKKNVSPSRVVMIVVLSFLSLVILCCIGGFLFINHQLNKMSGIEPANTIAPENEFFEVYDDESDSNDYTEIDPNDVTWETVETITDKDVINILLIGQDNSQGDSTHRSDSMIICSINTRTNNIALISLLRDMYVQIPGNYSDNRINASYAFGGVKLLNETISLNFGVQLDGNVVVDFSGFSDVIDVLGGVDVDVTEKEYNYIKKSYKNYPSILAGFHEGVCHLNGDQALVYARIRKFDSDFMRTQRQRKVLHAIYSSFRQMDFSTALSFLDTFLPLVQTDIKKSDILSYAYRILPSLSTSTITQAHIPGEGTYRNARIRNMAVLVPDLKANRELIYSIMFANDPEAEYMPSSFPIATFNIPNDTPYPTDPLTGLPVTGTVPVTGTMPGTMPATGTFPTNPSAPPTTQPVDTPTPTVPPDPTPTPTQPPATPTPTPNPTPTPTPTPDPTPTPSPTPKPTHKPR